MRVVVDIADLRKACPPGIALHAKIGTVIDPWTQYHALWFYMAAPDAAAWLRARRKIPTPDFSNMDLTGYRLENADLRRIRFCNTILSGVSFAGSDLTKANFIGATINDVQWVNANLLWALTDKPIPGWYCERGRAESLCS